MAQSHIFQRGLFHVTTNTKDKIPWCTFEKVPEIIIDNLLMTKNVFGGKVFAFCILPDHMHIVLAPGEKGLSRFMQSFKSHSMTEIKSIIAPVAASHGSPLRVSDHWYWQKGFHDELIRTKAQRSAAVNYITTNATKHGYAQEILDWPWTSFHFQDRLDPMDLWFMT